MRLPLSSPFRALLCLIVIAAAVGLTGSTAIAAKASTPTQFRSTAQSATTITLEWKAAAGAASYRVYYGIGSGKAVRHDVKSGVRTTISGLRPATTYRIDIASVSGDGSRSTYTTKVPIKTTAVAKPAVPTTSNVSATQMKLTWPAVEGAGSYRLYWGTNPDGSGRSRLIMTGTTATLTGLKPSTTYYVRMATRSAAGTISAYTTDARATTLATAPAASGSPTGVAIDQVDATSMRVTWDQVSGAAGYRLYWGTKADGTGRTKLDVGQGSSAVIPGLKPATKYYVRMAAKSSSGSISTYSADASATTSTVAAPVAGPPANVAVGDATATSMRVSWDQVTGASGYRVYWGTKADGTGRTKLDVAQGGGTTIVGLAPGTTYYVRVAAKTSTGSISPYSPDASVTTATASTPALVPPTGFAVGDVTSTSLQVKWKPAPGVTDYRLYWGTKADGTGRTALDVSVASEVVIPGLKPATKYYVKIASRFDGKSSAYTPDVSATTDKPSNASADISVASYNVFANKTAPTTQVWSSRRQAVQDNILAKSPDVIGLQEASQNPLPGTATKDRSFYFTDLVKGLPGYALTDLSAYNCEHDYSPVQFGDTGKRCYGDQFQYQGASAGTKIAYNSATMTLISSGSKLLSDANSTQWSPTTGNTYDDRYMAWSVLERKGTTKRMFFVNVHLTSAGSTAARVTQRQRMQTYIDQLNTAGLPVVVVGDFNVYPYQNAGSDYRQIITPLKDAGYRDPLGTQPNTFARATTGLADSIIGHPNCDSVTHFRRKLPLASAPIDGEKDCWYSSYTQTQYNGNNIDYIFTRGVNTVKEWETVMNLDSEGNLVGVIPSDHHMIRAVVTLP